SELRPRPRARVWLWAAAAVVTVLVLGALVVGLGLTRPSAGQQSIKVTKVYLDRVDAPSGMSYYLMDVDASNTAPTAWHFDPAFLAATSNSSATFSSNGSYNGTALLGVADIAPQQHLVGKVAFELPANQGPTKLSYADSKGGVTLQVTNVPSASAVASLFNYNAHMIVNGTGPTVQGQGWGFGSLIVNGVIENNTLVFFSGEKVQVNLWFEYLKRPVDPATITIQSVTAGSGFQVLGADKPVPFTMTGWGSQAGIVLLLKVLQGQHSGNIDLSVSVSA
ncbi:MAG: hypothetical protein OK436_07470, partial [Thaumarchaeota archaeon]|nr:hypothetical protein [Nitrososphaerota archaeon]